MLTYAIIDNKPNCDLLGEILEKTFGNELELSFASLNFRDGSLQLKQKTPDLFFIRMEVPGFSGYEIYGLSDRLFPFENINPENPEYLVRSLKYSPFFFLTLPVNSADLKYAIQLYILGKNEKHFQQQFLADSNIPRRYVCMEKLAIPTFDGFQLIPVEEIVYCKASENYSQIITKTGEEHTICKPLKWIEQRVPPDRFFRIHKSLLLNLNYVKSFSRKNGNEVTLENGMKFDVANRRAEAFIRIFTQGYEYQPQN